MRDLNKRKMIAAILDIKNDMVRCHVGAYAAQGAYFIILSFLPLVILLLSLIQYTGVGKAELYGLIQTIVPFGFQSWLIGIVDEMYAHTIAAVSVSAVVTVWSAGKSFMALNRGMDSISRVEKKPNYFLMRIRGAIFALTFVILIVTTLVFVVFGTSIHELFLKYFPLLAAVTGVLLAFRMVLMLALFILFFALLYMVLPNRRAGFIEQLPGAIFAAVGWYLFSFGFSVYIEYSHAFNMYGSLTTAILLMFWLYFAMYIVLIGLDINFQLQYYWPRYRNEEE